MKLFTLLSALAVILGVSATGLGVVFYSDISTSLADFTNISEDSATDTPPLFGAPTVIGNKLMFFPTRFVSAAENGSGDTTAGILQLDVHAKNGAIIPSITIQEFGDWMLTGNGYAAANISGMLTVTDLDTAEVYTDLLTVTPAGPFQLPNTSGQFQAAASISFAVPGIAGTNGVKGLTNARIVFNNILQTVADESTAAFIQKKVIAGPGLVIHTPEPATMTLLLLGGMVACFRKLRRS